MLTLWIPGVFPKNIGWWILLFLRVYHVFAIFIKYLIIEAQTRASTIKSAISLHNFHTLNA